METKKLKDSIIELRITGSSVKDITKLLGCAKSTVSYHIQKAGMGGVHENFKVGESDDEFISDIGSYMINKICLLKSNGKTYVDIFTETNISYDKIKRVCRIFKLNKSNTKLRFDDPNFIDEIKRLYVELGSLKKVAKELKIGRIKVREFVLIKKQNESERKSSMVKHIHNHRKNRKIELVNYKGGCCEKCGYSNSMNALQFHHINPEDKDFTIGGRNYSIDKMKREVDKCVLLCSNCHVETHEEIDKYGFSVFIDNHIK